MTLLQQAGDGRLDLDTPVEEYLPGVLSEGLQDVTPRMLLNHTSADLAADLHLDQTLHGDTADGGTGTETAPSRPPHLTGRARRPNAVTSPCSPGKNNATPTAGQRGGCRRGFAVP